MVGDSTLVVGMMDRKSSAYVHHRMQSSLQDSLNMDSRLHTQIAGVTPNLRGLGKKQLLGDYDEDSGDKRFIKSREAQTLDAVIK